MRYKELTVHTTSESADIVASFFWDIGCNGVCIYDRNDILELYKARKWDYFDESLLSVSDEVLVKGYVSLEDKDVYALFCSKVEEFKKTALNPGSLEITLSEVDGDEWAENWKKFYAPRKIGAVTISPEWIKTEGDKVVYIDPGMAFGTGEHETTGLCIELMQDIPLNGKTVFDAGCGSGILGITALKLGAAKVFAADIDSLAVKASKHNAAVNNVELDVRLGDVLETESCADVVLANITADVLIRLSEKIKERVNKSGAIILSGIIKSRLFEVLKAYKSFRLKKVLTKGEWHALLYEVL